jgi:hypothetical protein
MMTVAQRNEPMISKMPTPQTRPDGTRLIGCTESATVIQVRTVS